VIRVNEDGYLGREERADIVIGMNPAAIEQDIADLKHGGLLLLDEKIKPEIIREDLSVFRMPVDELLKSGNAKSNLKVYLANMVYVGVLAALIQIDIDAIEEALNQHFNYQSKAVSPNMSVVEAAHAWALSKNSIAANYLLEPSEKNKNKIIIDGNTAAALGSLYGGLQFAAWYPITPASSVAESINEYIPQLRIDTTTNSTTCAVLQAEDELAAIGMVVGAGWAGLRAMTATSGPGLCLMSEFLGLAYFAEIPLVVWDIQRVGPSTGLPTRTSQGDLAFAYNMGHGDSDFIILLPGNINECYEFGWRALDIAEKYQTPVLVLSDLEIGMNEWIGNEFEFPSEEIDRGKVLWEEDLKKIQNSGKNWARYKDVDADGIPYRTVPGNMHPEASYFARGTGHDELAHYSEDPATWMKNLERLKNKYISSVKDLPTPIAAKQKDTKFGILSYGSTDLAISETLHLMRENNPPMDYMRIRAVPFDMSVADFLKKHEMVFVVEANRDGQMKNILCENFPSFAHKLISIAKIDGLSLSAEWISQAIEKYVEEN